MEVTSLMDLLSRLKLDKYISTFEAENIDLGLFLQLNDEDLTEIGIKVYIHIQFLKFFNFEFFNLKKKNFRTFLAFMKHSASLLSSVEF